jgi:hypothetical protein
MSQVDPNRNEQFVAPNSSSHFNRFLTIFQWISMDFKRFPIFQQMSQMSSRCISHFTGHTVYKLSVERHGGDNTVMTSEVFFVDLAGRENERTTRVSGERLVELSFINRSWAFC